jgi:2-keto-4-pentenoate hydratase/2-oxohepta-3-ene-1,7-dioic acid hydratase in catechol pathway
MTFRLANVAGRAALVDPLDRWYDLERVSGGALPSDPMAALADLDALHAASAALADAAPDGDLIDAVLEAPVPRPRNVFAVGLNYRNHAAESGMELPATPLVFTKFPSCIVGPGAEVSLRTESGDYEVELVVVIGRGGRDIAATDAWQHVAGLTIGQDISDRALQFAAKPPHFDLGKSRDTFGPMGPVLVSTDSFTDPADLAITCDVNGERRQDDRTSQMIFDVPTLIAYLSGIITLATGDVIFSGTPEGVGVAAGKFLRPGDLIVSTIEGIGTITNRCIA